MDRPYFPSHIGSQQSLDLRQGQKWAKYIKKNNGPKAQKEKEEKMGINPITKGLMSTDVTPFTISRK